MFSGPELFVLTSVVTMQLLMIGGVFWGIATKSRTWFYANALGLVVVPFVAYVCTPGAV